MSFSLYPASTRRKKPLIKRFPVLIPILLFLSLLFGYQLVASNYTTASIGVVELNGVILDSEPIIKKLRQLEAEPTVKGIVLRINSPGGAVSPSQEIYRELQRLRDKKTIYTSVSSSAASGGYYVAIGTNKIFANPGSIVGSIGAVIQTFNFQELMGKIGIKSEVIKSGKNKDSGSMFRPMQEDERALLEAVILDTHDQFVSAIAENRHLELSEVKKIADGRIFSGRQAEKLGLIDGLASFRETVQAIKRSVEIPDDAPLYYPKDKEEIFQDFIGLESIMQIKEFLGQEGIYYLSGLLTGPR